MFLTGQLAEAHSFNTHLLSKPSLPGTRLVSGKWQNTKGLEEFRAKRSLLTRIIKENPVKELALRWILKDEKREPFPSKEATCIKVETRP